MWGAEGRLSGGSMKPVGSVPKFLTKIWALVEDPKTSEYICWSQDGNSFIVLDEESFSKRILPKHFKHNNMASFVRQLNWYGFRKVMHDETGAFKQERAGTGRYQHPFFKQGQEELLSRIKRKVQQQVVRPQHQDYWGGARKQRTQRGVVQHRTSPDVMSQATPELQGELSLSQPQEGGTATGWMQYHGTHFKVPLARIEDGKIGPEDVHKILSIIQQVQGRQDVVDSTVESLKRDNEALWKEVLDLRQKHFHHQQQFENMAQPHSFDQMICLQQNQPLMIDSTGNYNQIPSPKNAGITQALEKRSCAPRPGDKASQPRNSFPVKEEQPVQSSEEELEDTWTPKTENDRSKKSSYFNSVQSSSEMDELSKIDATSSSMCSDEVSVNKKLSSGQNPASMLSNGQCFDRSKPPVKDQKPVSKKRLMNTFDLEAGEDDDASESSELEDPEDQDDTRTTYSDFGHVRKRKKVKEPASRRIGHILSQMHKDNVDLTKRVLALEEQSLQKLSEISTTLSTLASFFMNTHPQRPPQLPLLPISLPPSKPEDEVNADQTPSQTPRAPFSVSWPKNSSTPAGKNQQM